MDRIFLGHFVLLDWVCLFFLLSVWRNLRVQIGLRYIYDSPSFQRRRNRHNICDTSVSNNITNDFILVDPLFPRSVASVLGFITNFFQEKLYQCVGIQSYVVPWYSSSTSDEIFPTEAQKPGCTLLVLQHYSFQRVCSYMRGLLYPGFLG